MPFDKSKVSLPREDVESTPLTSGEEQDHDEQPPSPTSGNAFVRYLHEVAERDPRFYQETPSATKRVLLLAFVALLFWLAFSMRRSMMIAAFGAEAEAGKSDRYSDEYMFRPAASPIIAETMKDGSVHFKGALPTAL
ncbi:hypothetical protein PLEOSDRAFT_1090887 [Pleurotus ostreatus PC15]|uniref:Transmembrane protein n=2 Tax=Pleurotus TaxID=5320 RepID=A0A067N281_PLEO1|nr:hypothetical protein CCMSSC00406_0007253 [Pleurotus cornucopiae]KDQ22133.1 hypothetical protein PLEOSDRAFT_1090887 [Pleurotus ostreatus PC15]